MNNFCKGAIQIIASFGVYYLCGRLIEIAFYFGFIELNSTGGKVLQWLFYPVFYLKSVLYDLGIPA